MTIVETATAAAKQSEEAQADVDEPQSIEEIIADRGYRSNQSMLDLETVWIRAYLAESARCRRDWSKGPTAEAPVLSESADSRSPETPSDAPAGWR